MLANALVRLCGGEALDQEQVVLFVGELYEWS
jgi:hypothetical protein